MPQTTENTCQGLLSGREQASQEVREGAANTADFRFCSGPTLAHLMEQRALMQARTCFLTLRNKLSSFQF